MKLNREDCIGCELCLPWCPVGAIFMEEGRADIDEESCTECGTCARPGVVQCPGDCFEPEKLEWPRTVRRFFSDPMATHEETGVPGRGTEESKTNDVTGRVGRGEVGLSIELGRPHVAARGRDIDLMTRALAEAGIEFEAHNPLTHLMAAVETGALKSELMDTRVISAIVEFTVPRAKLGDILEVIMSTAAELNTVFSLGLITRFDEQGELPAFPELEELGLEVRPNAKVNVGLGRPLFEEREQ